MADVYDKKSHWHACKREVLDKRLKKIKEGDYSEFFDYSSDFWLSLCIAYFYLTEEYIQSAHKTNSDLARALDRLFESKIYESLVTESSNRGYDWIGLSESANKYEELISKISKQLGINPDDDCYYFKIEQEGKKLGSLWDDLVKDKKKYDEVLCFVTSNVIVSEYDNLGIPVDFASYINELNIGASKLKKRHEDLYDSGIRNTRDPIGHGTAEIQVGRNNEIIHIPAKKLNRNRVLLGQHDYKLPVNWLVSYVDFLCSPERFFRDGSCPARFTTNDDVVNALGKIYRLYTANMHFMRTILKVDDPELDSDWNRPEPDYLRGLICDLLNTKSTNKKSKEQVEAELKNKIVELNIYDAKKQRIAQKKQHGYKKLDFDKFAETVRNDVAGISKGLSNLCAARDELLDDQENVIAALLYVANVNMYVMNYDNYFKTMLDPNSTYDLSGEREKLRDFMGTGRPAKPGVMGFHKHQTSCSGTIRNCSSHPGRITVTEVSGMPNSYNVVMQDYDNGGNLSGSLNANLDTFIQFLEHPFFEKNIGSIVTDSDKHKDIRTRNCREDDKRELGSMLDEISTHVEDSSKHIAA